MAKRGAQAATDATPDGGWTPAGGPRGAALVVRVVGGVVRWVRIGAPRLRTPSSAIRLPLQEAALAGDRLERLTNDPEDSESS